MKRKHVTIIAICLMILVTTDYFLESPDFLNKEIFFKKDFRTKFLHASVDFHRSLPCQDLQDMYVAVLDTTESCYIIDKLYKTAGYHAPMDSSLDLFVPVDSCLRNILSRIQQTDNPRVRFISEKDLHFAMNQKPVRLRRIVQLSPVKLIDGKLYVGCDSWSGGFDGAGLIFEIFKSNGKWTARIFTLGWIA